MPSVVSSTAASAVTSKNALINLSQVAGTYTLLTATGGDVLIQDISYFVSVAGVGLVSLSAATNNTVVNTLLGTTLLAALVQGANLTPFSTLTYLPSGKQIQYTIAGTGTGGSISVLVRYTPVTANASLN